MGLANFSNMRLLAIAFILGCGASDVFAQVSNPHDIRQSQHLLLLKNGQIIEGCVTNTSDTVLLTTTDGSKLVFQKDDVETVCESTSEAYWHKAAQTKATDLDGQKRLFHWCLSQQLPQFAQNQIDIMSIMNIKATELEYLHRQLLVAMDHREDVKHKAHLEQLADGDVPASSTTLVQQSSDTPQPKADTIPWIRPLPALDGVNPTKQTAPLLANAQMPLAPDTEATRPESEFAQVGFTEAVSTDSMPIVRTAETPEQSAVSVAELDRLTDSLPKPSVSMFKRKIEPLLTRSCFAGGCHQDNDSVMPLVRVGSGQKIPRRLSQRNLYSIIKHADPNEPLASPLLTAAITSHGGLTDPIIKPSSKQFQNLATWLIMISNKPDSIHQMPEPDLATRPDSALPADPALPEKREPVLPDAVLPEETSEDDGTTNPHDPDVFNRQFRNHNDGG